MAFYRHVASGTFPGETWSVTMHTLGSPDLPTAQTLWTNATAALWTGKLDALVTTNVTMTSVSTASMDQSTGKQLSRLITGVSRPGTIATATLPPQCSVGVSWQSAVATRAGRGRMYLPVYAAATLTGGRLSAASVTATIAAVKAMMDVLVAGALTPVLYGRTSHLTTPIAQFNVGDVIDTQRRRRSKLIETRTTSPL